MVAGVFAKLERSLQSSRQVANGDVLLGDAPSVSRKKKKKKKEKDDVRARGPAVKTQMAHCEDEAENCPRYAR